MRYVDPSGHSYATLPNGSRMSMNSPADVRRFNMLKQLPQTSQVKSTTAPVSKPTPITGGITSQKSTVTYTTIRTPEQIYASQKKNTSFLSSIFGAEYSVVAEADYSTKVFSPGSPLNVTCVDKGSKVIEKIGNSDKPISVYCQSVSNGSFVDNSVGMKLNVWKYSIDISIGLKNTGISLSYTNDNNATYFGYSASLYDLDVSCNAGNIYTEEDSSCNMGGSASINGGALYMMYCYVNGIPYETSKEKSYSPIPAY